MADLPDWAQLQTDAANALADAADADDWQRAVLVFRSAGAVAEAIVRLELTDGSEQAIAAPSAANTTMVKLRKAMASPEHGAWFTATITLSRVADGQVKVHADYDYDHQPDWEIQPSRSAYLADLEKYPRPTSEIPSWHPAAV